MLGNTWTELQSGIEHPADASALTAPLDNWVRSASKRGCTLFLTARGCPSSPFSSAVLPLCHSRPSPENKSPERKGVGAPGHLTWQHPSSAAPAPSPGAGSAASRQSCAAVQWGGTELPPSGGTGPGGGSPARGYPGSGCPEKSQEVVLAPEERRPRPPASTAAGWTDCLLRSVSFLSSSHTPAHTQRYVLYCKEIRAQSKLRGHFARAACAVSSPSRAGQPPEDGSGLGSEQTQPRIAQERGKGRETWSKHCPVPRSAFTTSPLCSRYRDGDLRTVTELFWTVSSLYERRLVFIPVKNKLLLRYNASELRLKQQQNKKRGS